MSKDFSKADELRERLDRIEEEIAAIQPAANDLLDRSDAAPTRAARQELRALPEWATVERWRALKQQRAELREEWEFEEILADPSSPRWQDG